MRNYAFNTNSCSLFFTTIYVPVSSFMSHISCLTSPFSPSCLLCHVFCLTSPVSCLLSHVSFTSHVSCLTSSVSPFLSTSPVCPLLSYLSQVPGAFNISSNAILMRFWKMRSKRLLYGTEITVHSVIKVQQLPAGLEYFSCLLVLFI